MRLAIRSRIVAIALLPLLAAACHSGERSEPGTPPVSAPGEAPDNRATGPASLDTPPTSREIRDAMLAVYARVVGLPKSDRPGRWQPISLERAADTLKRDANASVFGKSRRRRAIVRLTVAGLQVEGQSFTHKYRSFLERVDAPIAVIDAAITRRLNATAGLELDRDQLTADLYDATKATSALEAWCATPAPTDYAVPSAPCPPRTQVTGPTGVTANPYRATLIIQRHLKDLSRALDPQSWDEEDQLTSAPCNEYFNFACALRPNDLQYCIDCPPALGSKWSGPFEESFVYAWAGTDTDLEIQLNVTTDSVITNNPAVDRYRADFCLDHCRLCKIGENYDGTIDIDDGFSHVVPVTGQLNTYKVTVEKWIQFSGYGDWQDEKFNELANILIPAMVDALEEQACGCSLSDPECTAPPSPTAPGHPVLIP